MAEHMHLQCESCERVFCTDDARYSKMAEGDTCPSCHVAVVARMPEMMPEPGLAEIAPQFGAIAEAFTHDVMARRVHNLMQIASRLFPFLSQDFSESEMPQAIGGSFSLNDGRRAQAAVEVAFLMEDMIVSRLTAESAGRQEQEKKS